MMMLGCFELILFPISAVVGFFRGRSRGIKGQQLQWPFFVIPVVASLVFGAGLFFLIASKFGLPEENRELIFAMSLGGMLALIAVPYIGGGIAGFYLGKRKRDTDDPG